MNRALSKAEVNHLRRLIGYVRCEIMQSPDELVATVQSICPAIGEISDEGKQRLWLKVMRRPSLYQNMYVMQSKP
jgi:hypothetical protein